MKGQKMRINISLPEDLLSEFDKYCKEKHFERSEMIRGLIRATLLSAKGIVATSAVDVIADWDENNPKFVMPKIDPKYQESSRPQGTGQLTGNAFAIATSPARKFLEAQREWAALNPEKSASNWVVKKYGSWANYTAYLKGK